jgi:O-succinylbenzoic acid--CoA ligase
MDPSLLTKPAFWKDTTPVAMGDLAAPSELKSHVLFETSGSSGTPKWVAIQKLALWLSATVVNRNLEVTQKSRWGLALPVHHVGGFGVATRAFISGGTLRTFDQRWDATAFRDWLARERVSHTSLVPTQVYDLVKANLTAPKSLVAIVVGGGHLDPITGQAARDLGWPVLASYGLTETASQIASQGLDQLKLPYQAAPIPLLQICRVQTTPEGLLQIRGATLFSGYVSDGKFTPRGSTDWFTTQDRVIVENDALTPLGRADTLVKILGELVDPEAIEHELLALSGGKLRHGSFAVIAIPDERAGHTLVPVFDASVDPAAIATTLERYQQQAPGFRRLLAARIVETMPRSELGKLRRSELRQILA